VYIALCCVSDNCFVVLACCCIGLDVDAEGAVYLELQSVDGQLIRSSIQYANADNLHSSILLGPLFPLASLHPFSFQLAQDTT
jgi:hypothetical protein